MLPKLNQSISPHLAQVAEVNDSHRPKQKSATLYIIIGSGYNARQEYQNEAVKKLALDELVYVLSIDSKAVPNDQRTELHEDNINLFRLCHKLDLNYFNDIDDQFFSEQCDKVQKHIKEQNVALAKIMVCDSIDTWKLHSVLNDYAMKIAHFFDQYNLTPILFSYVTPCSSSSDIHESALNTPVANFINPGSLPDLSHPFLNWMNHAILVKSNRAMQANWLVQCGSQGGWIANQRNIDSIIQKICKSDTDRAFLEKLPEVIINSLMQKSIDSALMLQFGLV